MFENKVSVTPLVEFKDFKLYTLKVLILLTANIILYLFISSSYEHGYYFFFKVFIPIWFALIVVVLFVNNNYLLKKRRILLNVANWLLSGLIVVSGVMLVLKNGIYDVNGVPSFAYAVSLVSIIIDLVVLVPKLIKGSGD